MQFLTFKNIFQSYLIFSKNDIDKLLPGFNYMNLNNWQKKGYIIKLRNRMYVFSDIHLNENNLLVLANKIYSPSYISLETALYYYGFIPEAVFKTTSLSTKKTSIFKTKLGEFSYRNIKTSCFFGYRILNEENHSFKIAEPEKAIIDFLYLKSTIKNIDDLKSYRLNKAAILELIDLNKLKNYTNLIESKALTKRINFLINYLYA